MISLLIVCSFCCDLDSLKNKKETSLDRLKVGANRFVTLDYDKFKKKMDQTLKQKMEDSKLTEDAVITSYITDWLFKNEKVLLEGPEKASRHFSIELAMHIKLMLEKKFVWKGWEKYDKEISLWAEWFLKEAKK